MRRNRQFPSPIQAMLTLFVSNLLRGIGVFLFVMIYASLNQTQGATNIESLLVNAGLWAALPGFLFAYGILFFVICRYSRIPLRQFLPLRSFPPLLLLALLPLVFSLAVADSETDNIVRYFIDIDFAISTQPERSNLYRATQGLFIVLLIPLVEQILFLGIFLRGFLTRFRPRQALLIVSLLYVLFQIPPTHFIGGFCLVLLSGWLYIHTRSLWPGLLTHVLFSAGSWAAQFLPAGAITGFSATLDPNIVQFHPLWFDLAGAVALVIGLLIANFALGLNQVPERLTNR